jgi:Uncharacterized protein conserved in bacteria (DUF2188)
MAERSLIKTVHEGGRWANVGEEGKVLSRHLSKIKAIEAGRVVAERRRVEHVVHNEDGSVAGRSDYSLPRKQAH